jgi:hypothetical protein
MIIFAKCEVVSSQGFLDHLARSSLCPLSGPHDRDHVTKVQYRCPRQVDTLCYEKVGYSADATSRAHMFRAGMASHWETRAPGDLWLQKRKWCDHASSREAARADAESRWRRGRNPNERVTSSAGRREIRLFVAEFTKNYSKLKQPKCLSDLDPMTAAVHLDKFGLPSIQST